VVLLFFVIVRNEAESLVSKAGTRAEREEEKRQATHGTTEDTDNGRHR